MQRNWPLFEPFFKSVGSTGGKEKSLGWLDSLNELRRLVGHPLKKHVSGYSFSVQDNQLLADADEMTKRLLNEFRTRT